MSGAREIAAALGHGHRVGHDFRCDCPVHSGHSLTIADGRDGKLLVKCFGGCDWRDIFNEFRALGLISGRPVDVDPGEKTNFAASEKPPRGPKSNGSDAALRRLATYTGIQKMRLGHR